jgi:hypothetical protein
MKTPAEAYVFSGLTCAGTAGSLQFASVAKVS